MSTVFFKLATTGLPRYGPAEVVSIGAVTSDGIEFQEFINPIGKIHRGASKVHGFHKVRGQLYLDGTRVLDAMDPETGLNSFMDWLEHVDCTFLVAHNNFAFHWEVLEQNLVEYQIPPPTFQVIDSLQFVQDEFPMLRNIALQDCLFSICGIECDYIDELSDAYHCRRICEEGANLLGFEDFEEYLCNVSQPTLLSRSIREGHVCRCN